MLRVGLGRITPVNARTTPPASFLLNFADLGAGAVSLVESAGNATPTFVRATAAASKLSTGLWKLDVATGVARYTYAGLDTTVTTTGGFFAEGARTNSVLQARDLTNAAWTKSNLTTAKTSTGIDGAANSCTRCTASAGNGTALQAVTLASAAKAFGVWIKRITGSGEIDITLDNGSTWTNITAQINSATFTLVQATQTLANPTVGIRVVTSADAVDVDVCQLEDGVAFISSPVSTTVAAVTRNADVLLYPATFFNNAVGTVFAQAGLLGFGASNPLVFTVGDGNGEPLIFTAATTVAAFDGTNIPSRNISSAITAQRKIVCAWDAGGIAVTGDGLSVGTSAFDGSMGPGNGNVGIGTQPNGTNQMFGTVSSIRYFPRRLSDSVLQQITT